MPCVTAVQFFNDTTSNSQMTSLSMWLPSKFDVMRYSSGNTRWLCSCCQIRQDGLTSRLDEKDVGVQCMLAPLPPVVAVEAATNT